jgi:hypothetical protein
MDVLEIPVAINDRLLTYLDVPTERMAFLLAEPTTGPDSWAVVDELYLTDEVDYAYQGAYGIELADAVRARVLTWATRPSVALVEVHSHGPLSHRTTFSPTDLKGLEEVVPQMLWRLGGRPYAAVVLGAVDLDALAWSHRGQPPVVPGSIVLGDRTLTPTGFAVESLTTRHDR